MHAPADNPAEETHPLYWEASYEIVLSLLHHYPAANLDSLGLDELQHMIVALPGFADDPALANDEMLVEILREYYEETIDDELQRRA